MLACEAPERVIKPFGPANVGGRIGLAQNLNQVIKELQSGTTVFDVSFLYKQGYHRRDDFAR